MHFFLCIPVVTVLAKALFICSPDSYNSRLTRLLALVKINKSNITRMESGSLAGGAVMPYHSWSIADPTRRDRPTLCLACEYYFTMAAQVGRLPPPLATPQPMRGSHNSASEKLLCFTLPVYSNGLFVYNSSSVWEQFLSFALGTCLCLCVPGVQFSAILEYTHLLLVK